MWSFILGVFVGVIIAFIALAFGSVARDEPPPNG
jgi:hypothetical protein